MINSLPLWKLKVSKIAISSLIVFVFYQNENGQLILSEWKWTIRGFDSKLSSYNIFVHITIIKSYIIFFIYSHKKMKWVTKVGHRKTLLRLNDGKGHCWFIEAGRRLSCSNHNLWTIFGILTKTVWKSITIKITATWKWIKCFFEQLPNSVHISFWHLLNETR